MIIAKPDNNRHHSLLPRRCVEEGKPSMETKWEGSVYSATSSGARRPVEHNKAADIKTVNLAHCGTIEIHEQPKQKTYSRTGVLLWSAAIGMSSYIDEQCYSLAWNPTSHQKNLTCLELGSGLGLPSIVAAKHGFNCYVTESDPEVLPMLEANIQKNTAENDDDDIKSRIHIQSFDWSNDISLYPTLANANPDLIMASDIIYNGTRPYWKSFVSLLNQFQTQRQQQVQEQEQHDSNSNRDTSQHHHHYSTLKRFDGTDTPITDPLVLLGYTQRRRDLTVEEEHEFFSMLQKAGLEAHIIPYDKIPNSDRHPLTALFELRWKKRRARTSLASSN